MADHATEGRDDDDDDDDAHAQPYLIAWLSHSVYVLFVPIFVLVQHLRRRAEQRRQLHPPPPSPQAIQQHTPDTHELPEPRTPCGAARRERHARWHPHA